MNELKEALIELNDCINDMQDVRLDEPCCGLLPVHVVYAVESNLESGMELLGEDYCEKIKMLLAHCKIYQSIIEENTTAYNSGNWEYVDSHEWKETKYVFADNVKSVNLDEAILKLEASEGLKKTNAFKLK